MATTPEQRARRRAQREIAKRVKEKQRPGGKYRKILPGKFSKEYKQAREDYARAIMRGDIDRPPKKSTEGRSLAGLASAARWGNAPAEFMNAFKDYWYHKEKRMAEEDEEIREDEEDEEDEE